MKRLQFEQLVLNALSELPREVHERLENVEVLVDKWPTREQLVENGAHSKYELFGLY